MGTIFTTCTKPRPDEPPSMPSIPSIPSPVPPNRRVLPTSFINPLYHDDCNMDLGSDLTNVP